MPNTQDVASVSSAEAAETHYVQCARMLLSPMDNLRKLTQVQHNAANGKVHLLKDLGLFLPLGANSKVGPALTQAVVNGRHDALECLVSNKVPLEMCDEHQQTALFGAVSKGDMKSFQILVEAGARCDGVRDDGLTLLHLAAYRNHAPLVERLLSRPEVSPVAASFPGTHETAASLDFRPSTGLAYQPLSDAFAYIFAMSPLGSTIRAYSEYVPEVAYKLSQDEALASCRLPSEFAMDPAVVSLLKTAEDRLLASLKPRGKLHSHIESILRGPVDGGQPMHEVAEEHLRNAANFRCGLAEDSVDWLKTPDGSSAQLSYHWHVEGFGEAAKQAAACYSSMRAAFTNYVVLEAVRTPEPGEARSNCLKWASDAEAQAKNAATAYLNHRPPVFGAVPVQSLAPARPVANNVPATPPSSSDVVPRLAPPRQLADNPSATTHSSSDVVPRPASPRPAADNTPLTDSMCRIM